METAASRQRWQKATLALLGATLLCFLLLGIRAGRTGSREYNFLAWNLVLAWVPFLLALALVALRRRGGNRVALWSLGAVWLLFLPNAPYMVTDYVHLARGRAPFWYDLALISALAAIGLILGLASLSLVEQIVSSLAGGRWPAIFALTVCTLSSVGIYLGRFQRLNSWDVFTRPRLFFDGVHDRLTHPFGNMTLVVVTLVSTAFLSAAYFLLWHVTVPRVVHLRERRDRA